MNLSNYINNNRSYLTEIVGVSIMINSQYNAESNIWTKAAITTFGMGIYLFGRLKSDQRVREKFKEELQREEGSRDLEKVLHE